MMQCFTPTWLAGLMLAGSFSIPALAVGPDWQPTGEALGKAGTEMAGGVYRVGLPRTDLKVTVDGVVIKPTLALGGWLAFERVDSEAMVMGDLVLTAEEVNPVMTKLTEDSIEIAALHNHLLSATPATFYVHVLGHGNPVKLAAALHDGLTLSGTPLGGPTTAIEVTALHTHMLDEQPRLFFMHFWANDDARKLAGGLRAALDHIHLQRG
jgi:hypothetical protein